MLGLLLLAAGPLRGQTHVVVITGLSGEPRYAELFEQWATTLIDAARERWNVPESNVVYLAEEADGAAGLVSARSTRENIQRELEELAARTAPGDQIIIVLIGHGSTRAGEARFNLPGPDMTAADFDALLQVFGDRKVALINGASASGDFIPELSAPDRVVVTATRSGRERSETMFPRFFVQAFAGDDADADKDGRVSILEAFNYAQGEVARAYEREGRLLTEHALLDDNGDGVGSDAPGIEADDGALAQAIYLAAGPGDVVSTSDPRLRTLYERRRALEREIAELRARKDELSSEEYERELERLLVEVALTTREIRALEGGER